MPKCDQCGDICCGAAEAQDALRAADVQRLSEALGMFTIGFKTHKDKLGKRWSLGYWDGYNPGLVLVNGGEAEFLKDSRFVAAIAYSRQDVDQALAADPAPPEHVPPPAVVEKSDFYPAPPDGELKDQVRDLWELLETIPPGPGEGMVSEADYVQEQSVWADKYRAAISKWKPENTTEPHAEVLCTFERCPAHPKKPSEPRFCVKCGVPIKPGDAAHPYICLGTGSPPGPIQGPRGLRGV